jgi:hypothetical protein
LLFNELNKLLKNYQKSFKIPSNISLVKIFINFIDF